VTDRAHPQHSPTTFAARDAWMRAVVAVTDLSEGARLAAVRLALFLRVTTGRCDPGYERLADVLGISERSVFRRIAELERAGWIVIDRKDGRGKLSQFRLVTPVAERVTAASSFPAEKKVTAASSFPAERVTAVTEKGDSSVSKRVTPGVSHKAFLTAKRKAKKDSPRADAREGENGPDDLDEAFEEFFRQWPREKQSGKDATRRLFKRLVRSGRVSVAELQGGAMRYGAACEGRDLAHIATPLNWLKDEKWDEQFAPARPQPMSGDDIAEMLAREAEEQERGR
jgi:biotin operon repressor